MIALMKCVSEKEINSLNSRDRVRLINSISGVKSVNLIGTQNMSKQSNLSIVSSLFHLGAAPPLFGFVIRPDSARRDTLENLRKHPYLTVNHVNKAILEAAHQTSARYEENESEFDCCDLTHQFLDHHQAPFVKESLVKFSAKLLREVSIVENGTHLLICKIINIYFENEDYLSQDHHVNIVEANSVGVSGLDTYLSLDVLGRLSYAKPKEELKWLRPS